MNILYNNFDFCSSGFRDFFSKFFRDFFSKFSSLNLFLIFFLKFSLP